MYILRAGINRKAIFWLGIMVLTQISRSRFKQSKISQLIPHIYVLGCFVNFWGDFCTHPLLAVRYIFLINAILGKMWGVIATSSFLLIIISGIRVTCSYMHMCMLYYCVVNQYINALPR